MVCTFWHLNFNHLSLKPQSWGYGRRAYIGFAIEGSLHISLQHPTISYVFCMVLKLWTGIARRASPVLGRWCLCVSSTDFDCLPPRAAMQKISKFTLKLWHSGPTALGWMQVFKTERARERERNRNTKRKRERERERICGSVGLWLVKLSQEGGTKQGTGDSGLFLEGTVWSVCTVLLR